MKRCSVVISIVFSLMILVAHTTASAETRPPQKIRVAAFNFYPTLFQEKDGSVQGFYVDFLDEIAKREGWTIEYVYGNWADGLARIKSGQVDVLTNVAFTPERAQFMDFGKIPLLTVWAELYVPNKSTIVNIGDVKDKRIAVMKGDFNGANFKNLAGKFGIPCSYVEYGNFEEVFRAIADQKVDGGVVNNTFGTAKQKEYDIRSSGVIFNPFDIYFAVGKGKNGAVLATLDQYLDDWRKSENSPYHLARKRWSHGSASTIEVLPPWIKESALAASILLGIAVAFLIVLRIQVRRKTAEISRYSEELRDTARQLEEQLAEQQETQQLLELYREALDNASDSTYLVNRDGSFSFVNRAACETLGYSREEMLRMNVYDIDPNPTPKSWDEHWRELSQTKVLSFNGHHKAKDGTLIPMELGLRFFSFGGEDFHLAIARNLSERVKAEAALRQSEEKFRSIIESSPLGMHLYSLDSDGNLIFLGANPAAEKMLSIAHASLVGKPLEEAFPGLQGTNTPELYRDVAQGVLGQQFFETHYNDGQINGIFEVQVYQASPEILVTSFTDITERRRAEEEHAKLEQQLLHTQKLESLGVLAGGIAHDFNNILTSIVGNTDLALMKLNPESPVRDNLERVEQAAARASELAKQMLAYSGKGKFVVESLDLNRLLKEMLHMLEVSISKKAVLRFNLCPTLPAVEGDATQMRQIVMNLVINASEAIADTSGVIAITTGSMHCDQRYLKDVWLDENPKDGVYVYVEISDTGCGMDKETLAKIFDPFFTTKFTGRGLGMAAVLGIIRGHKGAIKVYSEPGKGTAFKVLLPASDRPAGLVRGDDDQAGWQGSGKVLLVDDEETVRSIGSEMLQALGFTTITAEDGREALHIFQENEDIACVILDLTMPHLDGEQCFRELRQLKPDVKVIMSSGYNEQEITQKFAGKGLAGFIQKPYKLSTLRSVLINLDNQHPS